MLATACRKRGFSVFLSNHSKLILFVSGLFCYSNSWATYTPEDFRTFSVQAERELQSTFDTKSEEERAKQAMARFGLDPKSAQNEHGEWIIPNDPKNGTYSVSPKRAIANLRNELLIEAIHEKVKGKYPKDGILNKIKWVFNDVGGINTKIAIGGCSDERYFAYFGTNTPMTGFSGRYPSMDVYDVMIQGKMISYGADDVEKTFRLGDISKLSKKDARTYRMEKDTYMADVGIGKISHNFFKGIIGPFLFSNYDATSLEGQIGGCIQSMFSRLKQFLSDPFHHRDPSSTATVFTDSYN